MTTEPALAGAAAAAASAPTPLRKLHASRFKLAESIRNVYAIVPEDGTPFEAVLKRDYWAHVSARMKPGDRIEVLAEDGSYFAELIVLASGHLYASVEVLRKVDLGRVEPLADNTTLSVEWKGPHHRWAVVRLSDKQVLKSGFQEKTEANKWAANHLKAA